MYNEIFENPCLFDLEGYCGAAQTCNKSGEKVDNIPSQIIRGTRFFNFSGRYLQEVIRHFPHDFEAKKVVLLPDFSPGRAPLPTGCSVEIDTEKFPGWRRFAVSDVGCGMQVVKSQLSWEKFEDKLGLWDEVCQTLKSKKGELGDLGSGNHFLDATVDEENQVYFVIHTGSRDESPKATDLVDKPDEFDQTYTEILNWAKSNRDEVRRVLEGVYGDLEVVLDKTHNFYQINPERNSVVIYKGSVKLYPGEQAVIPSSMDGQMALVSGKSCLRDINFAISHGTGRIMSRSQSKDEANSYDFEGLRKRIHIPTSISDSSIRAENSSCYRSLDDCLNLLSTLITANKRLTPIAYIGQI